MQVNGVAAFIVFFLSCILCEELHSSFVVRRGVTIPRGTLPTAVKSSRRILSCARACGKEPLCKYASFDGDRKTCVLLKESTVEAKQDIWTNKENSLWLEKVDYHLLKGTTKPLAVTNCKELLAANPSVTSGVYWIDPDGGPHDNAFTAYCDQDTDGGGWTLVWSYGFTDYVNFNKPQNAITPRPNWQCNTCDVDVSTTPPSSETDYNAMEFRLWREIGSDVLIKSNINNWVACKPGTGSLLDWQEGSVTCRLIKEINPKCEVIPSRIKFFNHGPAFAVSRLYYYFDGYKGNNWPTHDPCGMNLANQLTGVANPHGNIFVR